VIGVSGGLDSTQALIVAVKAIDRLRLPRANVLAFTMPGFATSETTRVNAHTLMRALGVTGAEIDIKPACLLMLRDLGHPFATGARGKDVYDLTFENVQAGERTSHLFRLANHHQALVVGTGDLSELALGWCTYGVGDQMSHYNVNVSVPKTLIQYLIAWVMASKQFDDEASAVFDAILKTKISPELVPGDSKAGSESLQMTETAIGPFELQDFNLYYISRFGYPPSKVAFLAHHAWGDRMRGDWPDTVHEHEKREYALREIKRWLEVFVQRFFQLSQFKRSCLPNGPKVGSGGSLSPRSDWRAPSDAEADAWLQELRERIPDV
jgi:NAD+ synthase (glutamine-hydrolysing)